MRRQILKTAAAIAVFFWFTLPATLTRAAPVRTQHVEAELVPGVSTFRPSKPFWIALRLKMDRGWHTYWKNPGDSGLEPRLSWSLPQGWGAGEIQWPTPERIDVPPLTNYGYENEVLFPIRITPNPSDAPATKKFFLSAKASWLVCKDVCIPEKANLTLELVSGEQETPDPVWSRRMDLALKSLPKPWKKETLLALDRGDHFALKIPGSSLVRDQRVLFFPAPGVGVHHAAPQMLEWKGPDAFLSIKKSDLWSEKTRSVSGVLKQGGTAFEIQAQLVEDKSAQAPSVFSHWAHWASESRSTGDSGPSLIWVLFLALLGGLVLNLMPCVFPVLSIKAFQILKEQDLGRSRSESWGHWLYTLGVVSTLWVLSGALWLLKKGGSEIGWGFQLQSTEFVSLLIILFSVLAGNLLGWFDVSGFSFRSSPKWGAWGSGVLAVIVSTPCSAPFMGTAIGFALSQDLSTILGVFTSLGMGLALPYLLLGIFPSLSRWLPRPGKWMVVLKQILAVPLLGTVLWLVWVVDRQNPSIGWVPPVASAGLALLACWAYGLSQRSLQGKPKSAGLWSAAALITAAILIAVNSGRSFGLPLSSETRNDSSVWIPYREELLMSSLQQARPVFIDFTAAWCITCQVNKKVALDNAEVQKRFSDLGVVLLRADWTSQDPEITRKLAEFGRNSVPLYLYFDSKTPNAEPKILPEILTPGIVLKALSP